MKHTLIARLGPTDRQRVAVFWPDAEQTHVECMDLLNELDYGLGDAMKWLAGHGLRPKEAAIDVALLAALIFGADTRIPRDSEAQDGWTREIEINVPVSDVGCWDQARPILERALMFLTGDLWRFGFRSRPKKFANLAPTVQPELHRFSCVALFSGGLDSYIGAVDQLGSGQTTLFVSHYLSHTSKNQKLCMDHLVKRFPKMESQFFRARVGFDKDMIPALSKVPRYDGEKTERSRSFLFFGLAALAASSIGHAVQVQVPENGLIALNVPLDRLRVGALSTRTTHPFFIARFNQILKILNIEAEFTNPYRFKTKGEMARECLDAHFIKETAKDTISCSSPGKGRYKGQSPGHCGHCMPCLIRRAALVAAFGADDTPYTLDKLRGKINSKEATGLHIRSFQVALEKLRSVKHYASVAVRIPGPLTDCPAEVPSLVGVYERGMQEVGQLLKNVKTAPI